jgi:hypothetical protein
MKKVKNREESIQASEHHDLFNAKEKIISYLVLHAVCALKLHT